MIIYSEILNKEFDTVEKCIDAEVAFKREQRKKEKEKEEHQKKLDAAYDKAMKAIDEYLDLAGITVEETENGYKITECVSDESAEDIWDSIIEALMREL